MLQEEAKQKEFNLKKRDQNILTLKDAQRDII